MHVILDYVFEFTLTDYREELKKLRTESHQQQLIQKVPTVIAEKNENEVLSLDLTKDDHLVKRNSPMPILLPGNSPALVDIAGDKAPFDAFKRIYTLF